MSLRTIFQRTLALSLFGFAGLARPTTAGEPAVAPLPVLAILDVNVVPMDSARVLPHQNVVIRGDRIVTVGPTASVAVPREATRIDGRGRWLMPGLIDMHVHLNDEADGTL